MRSMFDLKAENSSSDIQCEVDSYSLFEGKECTTAWSLPNINLDSNGNLYVKTDTFQSEI